MQARRILDYVFITLKGMAMGAADVVPGVSGGTIAFISGIYEELITSINNIDLSLIKILRKDHFMSIYSIKKEMETALELIGLTWVTLNFQNIIGKQILNS